MRATANELRAKAGQVSPSSRLPRAQEIALALAEQSETPVPSLSASPEAPIWEHPPSPHTPPEWDLEEDGELDQQHSSDDAVHPGPWLRFTSPSSVPQLLQPLITMSPDATFDLSALDMLDPRRIVEFASIEPAEVAESDTDAVDSGDHPDLQQPHDDLPSRQDVLPDSCDEHEGLTLQADTSSPSHGRPFMQGSTRRPSRARSCPPSAPLLVYSPPRPSLLESRVITVDQATSPSPRTFESVAVQASPESEDSAVQVKVDGPTPQYCEVETQTDHHTVEDLSLNDPGDSRSDLCQDRREDDGSLVHHSNSTRPTLPSDEHTAPADPSARSRETSTSTVDDPTPQHTPSSTSTLPIDGTKNCDELTLGSSHAISVTIPAQNTRGRKDTLKSLQKGDTVSTPVQSGSAVESSLPPRPPPKDQDEATAPLPQKSVPATAPIVPKMDSTTALAQPTPTSASDEELISTPSQHSEPQSEPLPSTKVISSSVAQDTVSSNASIVQPNIPALPLNELKSTSAAVDTRKRKVSGTSQPECTDVTVATATSSKIDKPKEDTTTDPELSSSQTKDSEETHPHASEPSDELPLTGDIETGFTIVTQTDATLAASDRSQADTKQDEVKQHELSENWLSVDTEVAWNLCDRAEKGLVDQNLPVSDREKSPVSSERTHPSHRRSDSLRVVVPPPERHNPPSSLHGRDSARESSKEETKGSWMPFINKMASAVGFPTPTSSTPPTPSEDNDMEGSFVELSEAHVASLPKAEKDKYKKKLRKRRKQMEKRTEESRVDSLFSMNS